MWFFQEKKGVLEMVSPKSGDCFKRFNKDINLN